jgi:cell wall-associated NlpC family hydrolase
MLWLLAGTLAYAAKPTLPNTRVDTVVDGATKYLEVDYLFGAAIAQDDAVDCSSLMVKAFAAAGLTLPRSAFEQSKVGREVPLADIRRGDRLYFKMTDRKVAIDHTALYLGEGQMLHAFPGKGVSIEPLADYRSVLILARR